MSKDILVAITDALHGIAKEDLTTAEKQIATILIANGYAVYFQTENSQIFRRRLKGM